MKKWKIYLLVLGFALSITTSVKAFAAENLYRLYHSDLQVHLYTKDVNEYKTLAGRGWTQEGVAWQVEEKKGDIVYRLYHTGLRVHLYTKDKNEYRVLANRGWRQEGPAFRSYGSTPIYRLYHTGIRKHLYTKDANEYKVLGSRGWTREGVAFYGLATQKPVTSSTNPSTSIPKSSTRPSTSTSGSSTKPSTKTRTQIQTKEEVIPYQTNYQKDASMVKGREIIKIQGKDGKRTIQVTTTVDATTGQVLKQTSQVISEIPPVHKVVQKGILLDMRQMSSLAANQNIEVGDIFPSGAKVEFINTWDTPSLPEINQLSDEVLYQKAQDEEHFVTLSNGYVVGTPLTQGAIDYINANIDMYKLNQEMLKLINAERARLGRSPLVYGGHLQAGTTQRALEQAQIGNLRSNGVPHQRPNGESWETAFTYLSSWSTHLSGENVAQNHTASFYLYFNEKALAEIFYNQWKKSPGHYGNMTAKAHKYFSTSIQVGVDSDYGSYADFTPTLIGVQVFGSSYGWKEQASANEAVSQEVMPEEDLVEFTD